MSEISVGLKLWKRIPHKMVGPTWISPNMKVDVKVSVEKTMFLEFMWRDPHEFHPIKEWMLK